MFDAAFDGWEDTPSVETRAFFFAGRFCTGSDLFSVSSASLLALDGLPRFRDGAAVSGSFSISCSALLAFEGLPRFRRVGCDSAPSSVSCCALSRFRRDCDASDVSSGSSSALLASEGLPRFRRGCDASAIPSLSSSTILAFEGRPLFFGILAAPGACENQYVSVLNIKDCNSPCLALNEAKAGTDAFSLARVRGSRLLRVAQNLLPASTGDLNQAPAMTSLNIALLKQ